MVKQTMPYVFFLLVFLHGAAFAQDVRVSAQVDSNNVLIGDWIKLRVEVEFPADISVKWPSLPDSLEGLEIIQRQAPVIKKGPQGMIESATFVLTAFDSGTHVVPSLPFLYSSVQDTGKKTASTEPIPIFVHSIPIDTSQDIKDVKPPLSLPLSLAEALPYIIGIVGAGGLAWGIYYVLRKRRKGERIFPQPPARPPDEVALEALRALESEHLWQRGKVKEYHSRVTEILRVYSEQRFGIMAMEMTTDEILSSLATIMPVEETNEQLKQILVRADLVKFAKSVPLLQENEATLTLALSFVESTRYRKSLQEQELITESNV